MNKTTKISTKQFLRTCEEKLKEYYEVNFNNSITITDKNIFVVWYCKTLQNHKALLSSNMIDGIYFEFTFNGDLSQLYMDTYKKVNNQVFKIDSMLENN